MGSQRQITSRFWNSQSLLLSNGLTIPPVHLQLGTTWYRHVKETSCPDRKQAAQNLGSTVQKSTCTSEMTINYIFEVRKYLFWTFINWSTISQDAGCNPSALLIIRFRSHACEKYRTLEYSPVENEKRISDPLMCYLWKKIDIALSGRKRFRKKLDLEIDTTLPQSLAVMRFLCSLWLGQEVIGSKSS